RAYSNGRLYGALQRQASQSRARGGNLPLLALRARVLPRLHGPGSVQEGQRRLRTPDRLESPGEDRRADQGPTARDRFRLSLWRRRVCSSPAANLEAERAGDGQASQGGG